MEEDSLSDTNNLSDCNVELTCANCKTVTLSDYQAESDANFLCFNCRLLSKTIQQARTFRGFL